VTGNILNNHATIWTLHR